MCAQKTYFQVEHSRCRLWHARGDRKIIHDVPSKIMVGGEDNQVGLDGKASYLGVVQLGAKISPEKIQYLDGLEKNTCTWALKVGGNAR